MNAKELIEQGKTALGIEFGSTRIKGVLIDFDGNVLATGGHKWENSLVDGVWTYDLADVDMGLRACYTALRRDVEEKYGVTPKTFGAIGVSAMMHGYIALDRDDQQLARFQTWRNTNTTAAADELTELFRFNIPLRWSVAHLYQRMLDGEEHVKNVASVFTLAAYMHYKLTGKVEDFCRTLYQERYTHPKQPGRKVGNWLWKFVYLPGLYKRRRFLGKGAMKQEMRRL